ncbi:G protein-coupled receptor 184 [Salminus brasiliensis]|uniref:G protein-coupled receptor 184 n=1 Tax=Salminus brasiliensis TaxID=930266 RepID=UPI003B83440E
MNQTDNVTCVNIEISPISDLLMAIYIIALILGLIFHLLTAWPIVQQIRSKNVLAVYLFCLSMSDLLYILTMPLWIYYYHNDHEWTLGQGMCQLTGFIYYSNMYISIYLLCSISIDRCLVVTFPLKVKAFRHNRYAWLICVLIYVLVMLIHTLVLNVNKRTGLLDSQRHCYETYPITEHIAFFNFLRVGIGFLLPLLVLIVCYLQIFSKVQKSTGVAEQGKYKIKLLSIGVISIFSICFAPYHILLLARSIAFNRMDKESYCNFEQAHHLKFSCTLALSSLNSVVDPLLYVLVSNGIRKDMWHCC